MKTRKMGTCIIGITIVVVIGGIAFFGARRNNDSLKVPPVLESGLTSSSESSFDLVSEDSSPDSSMEESQSDIQPFELDVNLLVEELQDEAVSTSILCTIKNQYQVSNYDIVELDDDGKRYELAVAGLDPVRLGVVRATKAVMIQNIPNLGEQGFCLRKNETAIGFDEKNGFGRFKATTGTLVAAGVSDLTKVQEFDVIATEEYQLKRNGDTVMSECKTEVSGMDIRTSNVGFSPSILPSEVVKVGDVVTMQMDVNDNTIPSIQQDPPSITITVDKRVRFNNVDALLITSDSTGYQVITVTSPNQANNQVISSKTQTEYRAYVNLSTGRPLWAESCVTIVESDNPSIVGLKSVYREVLVDLP